MRDKDLFKIDGALDRDRTGDLILTKDVLCQLSYKGTRLKRTPRQEVRTHLFF
jgi:hypothetical protein